MNDTFSKVASVVLMATLLLSSAAAFALDSPGVELRYRITVDAEAGNLTVEEALDFWIIRSRPHLWSTGLDDVYVRRRGADGIIVGLPGMTREQLPALRERLEALPSVSFTPIHDGSTSYRATVAELVADRPSGSMGSDGVWDGELPALRTLLDELTALEPTAAGAVPPDARLVHQRITNFHPRTGVETLVGYQLLLVTSPAEMTGDIMASAACDIDPQTNQPIISMTLAETATDPFCQLTRRTVGSPLAIIVDDMVLSVPVVQEAICGGQIRITLGSVGSFEAVSRECQQLALAVRGSGLPSQLVLVEETWTE